jgi:hypothetical protein
MKHGTSIFPCHGEASLQARKGSRKALCKGLGRYR